MDFQRDWSFDIENLLVICDDLDLPLGTTRIRASGSSGGHKGVESIIIALDSQPFARLRIGIGPEDREDVDASSFVTSEFAEDEEDSLLDEFPKIMKAIECFCLKGVQEAMNLFN